MPRTDENGRSLESLLTYLLDGVSASDISAALGVSPATYYRRKREESYPNAEELRVIANRFDLNPVDLMVCFGLISADAAWGSARPVTTAKDETRRTFITPRLPYRGPGKADRHGMGQLHPDRGRLADESGRQPSGDPARGGVSGR